MNWLSEMATNGDMQYKMYCSYSLEMVVAGPVVFNLFHAAILFATQFNLTTPFRKFPVRHMKCSCVCKIENRNH